MFPIRVLSKRYNRSDPANRSGGEPRRSAFTLAELTIALLILGILAAAAAPRFADALARFRVEAAVQRVNLDLQFARERAKTVRTDQQVVFDPASNTYTLPGVPDMNHPESDYTVNLSDAPFQSSLVSADFGTPPDTTSTVKYNAYGLAYDGGEIVVRCGAYQESILVEETLPDCPPE